MRFLAGPPHFICFQWFQNHFFLHAEEMAPMVILGKLMT